MISVPPHRHDQYALAEYAVKTGSLFPESFGATGNGTTDDQAAITACIAAAQPGQTIVFAAGKTYKHSSYITVNKAGVRLTGGGTLTATNAQYAALKIAANNVTVENLTIQLAHTGTTLNGSLTSGTTSVVVNDVSPFPAGTGWKLIVDPGTSSREQMTVTARNDGMKTFTVTRAVSNTAAVAHSSGATVWPAVRQSGSESHLVYQYQASGTVLRNLQVKHGDAAGILSEYSSDYLIDNCTVTGGLADSFHNTHSCTRVRIQGCFAYYGGDDGVAIVSYDSAPSAVSDVQVDNCRIIGAGARGFSVVGGNNVSFTNCYTESSAAAGFYVACEDSFSSYGVNGVVVDSCSTLGANTVAAIDHGSLFLYNGRGGAYTISNVTFRNMTLRNTRSGASAELGVVGYNTPTADTIRYENVKAFDGPASVWNNNFTPTNWLKDVTQVSGYAGSSSLNMTLIGSNSATTASSVTVTCASGSYANFKILIETKGNGTADIPAIRFNGDTGTNYTSRYLELAATGTTLTETSLTGQTSARLGSVSATGERIIEVNFTKETLNCTGSVVQSRSPRDTAQASGAMEVSGRIQWYTSNYDPLTSVTVLNVGSNTFDYIKVWVYAYS